MFFFVLFYFQDSPFRGFFFETKGCSSKNVNEKQFEFVIIDAPFLAEFASQADPSSFAEHLRSCDSPKNGENDLPACVFSNLSGKSTLVAPKAMISSKTVDKTKPTTSITSQETYGHLANFLRKAPANQIWGTWRMVAQVYLDQLQRPNSVWFSTCGTGVAWLHFRFDDRPKYYSYEPFALET